MQPTRSVGEGTRDRSLGRLARGLVLLSLLGACSGSNPVSESGGAPADAGADEAPLEPKPSPEPTDVGASAELVTLASGVLPEPLAARRFTYVHRAPCEAGEAATSPLTPQSACCFTDRPEPFVGSFRVAVRRRGEMELVCLDAGDGSSSACAPVDPSGLSTFSNGIALQVLYSHWGLLYSALVSDTSLAVRLSSARDHATVDLAVYGRFHIGPGCASGAGSYVPPTRLEVPLAAATRPQGSE